MKYQLLLIAILSAATVAHENVPRLAREVDVREMEAIEERLAKYEVLEEVMRRMFFPEAEEKSRECLPLGSDCDFFSLQTCCGIDTRCVFFGYIGSKQGGGSEWRSECKQYRAGVWMKEVGDFFSSLG